MLTDTDVQHIADLARIKLGLGDLEKFRKELSAILDYIATLEKIPTDGVEPLYQTTGLVNATRSDEQHGELPTAHRRKLLVGQAPEQEGDFVKVKGVLRAK